MDIENILDFWKTAYLAAVVAGRDSPNLIADRAVEDLRDSLNYLERMSEGADD